MSRKTATIIIVAVVIALLGVAAWFYLTEIKSKAEPPIGGDTGPIVFPDGGTVTPETGGTGGTTGGTTGSEGETEFRPKFIQITKEPTAGGIIITEADKKPLVRYAERATGRVHDFDLSTFADVRVTNTTIPKVYEALWSADGTESIFRYLSENEESITTFNAEVVLATGAEEEGSLQGSFLQSNIRELALAPSLKKLFYLVWSTAGATGVVANYDGSGKSQVWSSPLREWLVSWPTPASVALTSKPSGDTLGSLMLVSVSNGLERNILSGVRGLTTSVNPAGTHVMYSESSDSLFSSAFYDISKRQKTSMAVSTLPEKCVWSSVSTEEIYCAVPTYVPPATYPDWWYQGQVTFSDDVWKINAKTGNTEFIVSSTGTVGREFDMINPSLDASEKFLLFINKKDLTLWVLQMRE